MPLSQRIQGQLLDVYTSVLPGLSANQEKIIEKKTFARRLRAGFNMVVSTVFKNSTFWDGAALQLTPALINQQIIAADISKENGLCAGELANLLDVQLRAKALRRQGHQFPVEMEMKLTEVGRITDNLVNNPGGERLQAAAINIVALEANAVRGFFTTGPRKLGRLLAAPSPTDWKPPFVSRVQIKNYNAATTGVSTDANVVAQLQRAGVVKEEWATGMLRVKKEEYDGGKKLSDKKLAEDILLIEPLHWHQCLRQL